MVVMVGVKGMRRASPLPRPSPELGDYSQDCWAVWSSPSAVGTHFPARPCSGKFGKVLTLEIQREHLLLLRVKSKGPMGASPALHPCLFCVKPQQLAVEGTGLPFLDPASVYTRDSGPERERDLPRVTQQARVRAGTRLGSL